MPHRDLTEQVEVKVSRGEVYAEKSYEDDVQYSGEPLSDRATIESGSHVREERLLECGSTETQVDVRDVNLIRCPEGLVASTSPTHREWKQPSPREYHLDDMHQHPARDHGMEQHLARDYGRNDWELPTSFENRRPSINRIRQVAMLERMDADDEVVQDDAFQAGVRALDNCFCIDTSCR